MAHDNPYQAPRADLVESYQLKTSTDSMTGPHSRPLGHGPKWMLEGFRYFRKSPGAWMGAVVVMFGISLVLSFIPILGTLASVLIGPVFMGGLMVGAQAQSESHPFEFVHLFAGFSHQTGKLIILGILYLVTTLLVSGFVAVVVGWDMMIMMAGIGPSVSTAELDIGDIQSRMLLGGLLFLLLTVPLMMAYWFAPLLVVLRGHSVIDAIKLSFAGCLRNILPFLLYGVLVVLASILAAIPLLLGFLVLGPMIVASIHAAYRDIYFDHP